MLAAVAILALLTGFTLGLIAGVHWKGKVDDERLSGFLTGLEAQAREDAIERAARY